MGVLSINSTFPVSSTYDEGRRVYKLPYKVETTTDTIEAQVRVAMEIAVPYNAQYVGDPLARLTRYEITQDTKTRDQWHCAAVFEYEVPDQGKVNPNSIIADLAPWQYPPLRSFSTVMRQKPVEKGWGIKRSEWHSRDETSIGDGTAVVPVSQFSEIGGSLDTVITIAPTDKVKLLKQADKLPIDNSAGFPFDPPVLHDVPHRVIHWKINYSSWNELLARHIVASLNYYGLGNRYDSADEGTIPDAWTYPPFSLKVLAFDAEEKLEGRFHWWSATLSVEYNPDLWIEEKINRGFTERVYADMNNDVLPAGIGNGVLGYRALKTNEPQLLDGFGRMWRKDRTPTEIKNDWNGIRPYIVQPVANFNAVFGTLNW